MNMRHRLRASGAGEDLPVMSMLMVPQKRSESPARPSNRKEELLPSLIKNTHGAKSRLEASNLLSLGNPAVRVPRPLHRKSRSTAIDPSTRPDPAQENLIQQNRASENPESANPNDQIQGDPIQPGPIQASPIQASPIREGLMPVARVASVPAKTDTF